MYVICVFTHTKLEFFCNSFAAKAEIVKYVNARVITPSKEENVSSKRVSKKSSRYADYFEPEEINCKRKRKHDGDDNEFDDDMDPEAEDLADVLKKKTTKQKPKIDCKRKKMVMMKSLTMI